MTRGVVAAGHPQTAEAGAVALRSGGNAVDAAIAAMLASFAAEPLLTGLGAGGYMLVSDPAGEAALLDFFVEMPGRDADPAYAATLVPVDVSFGDASQIFNVGPASVGVYGTPAGVCEARRRWGRLELSELAAPAIALARDGALVTPAQAYVAEILAPIVTGSPDCAALFAPEGRLVRAGDTIRNPDLADGLTLLGEQGSDPFYRGAVADAVLATLKGRASLLGDADLAAYEPALREPVRVRYRDREVLSNPPPSAGGTLISYALALLERGERPPGPDAIVAAMERAQAERTPEFLDGLAAPGFLERFLASRLGSTTHIAAIDADGWACSVTCSNGECSGVIVPGTGIHLNNMLGEHDLNPHGFHLHPPGLRLPSMMAPTIVMRAGSVELALGSAGSNRIRSAILQTVVNVVDRDMDVAAAVEAPRVHFEDGVVYAEPGADVGDPAGHEVRRFRSHNLFFGGVQAVQRDAATGVLRGAGDPRRGGAVVTA